MNPAFHFVYGRVFSARQSMYVCRARLRDNSRARLSLLCTYRLHVCMYVGYVQDTHGKDSCWIVTLASGGAVDGDSCPSPRNCLIGVEQAVVSSAAISISRHCPMWRRTSCRGTTLSVATAFPAPAPTCSSCWKPVLPNRWPTRTTRRPGCARLR